MSVYLHDIPLSQAQSRLREALQDADLWRVLGVESIPLSEDALGRVTAEPVWAEISSPHYHASAMDGFALRAVSTNGAMPSAPVTLFIGPEAQYVDTGDPLPEWANAVIPIENVESLDEKDQITYDIRGPKSIRIRAAVAPWSRPSIGGGYRSDATCSARWTCPSTSRFGRDCRIWTSEDRGRTQAESCHFANRHGVSPDRIQTKIR